MTATGWLSLAATLGAFAGAALSQVPPYLPMTAALVFLIMAGAVAPSTALGGFGNEAVVTVGALFIVAAGLRETGSVTFLVRRLLGQPRSTRGALTRLVVPVCGLSAVLNNTPVVAVLLPVVSDWARRIGIPASKLLIPLSYAAILGGLCTLLGTSTNLVIQGMLIEAGGPGLALFDVALVGVPCALVGGLFLILVGPSLLPAHADGLRALLDPKEYTLEMVVQADGPFVGQTIEGAGLRHLPGVYLAEIHRRAAVRPAVSPTEQLEAGDQLVFVGMVEAVVDLRRTPGLEPATRTLFDLEGGRRDRIFVEAVLSELSPLVGRTIREGRFRNHYNAVVLGVARQGTRIRARVGDIRLRAGDTLLLEAPPVFLEAQRSAQDFHLVSRLDAEDPPRHERRNLALALFIAMLLAAGLAGWPLSAVSLGAALTMVLTGCCSEETVRRRVDWSLLLTIGASIGLGRCLESTGAVRAMAEWALQEAHSPWTLMLGLYVFTALLSQLVTNVGAAVVAVPWAMATATDLGLDPQPFILGIVVAASSSFATPVGYQTNLMVLGAGGYRFGDFVRLGLPMTIVVALVALSVLKLLYL
jgi:di/tricarboxylate transporter